ncbi:MAG: hypothetical protein JWO02_1265 [Solirubrobacterales bacterium]|nr:hypothetical protein [Solirubrobacterales bacterium]
MRAVRALTVVFAAAATSAFAPVMVRAAAPSTVLQDDAIFLHRSPAAIRDALAKAKSVGIDRIRLTAGWSVIAPRPDDPQPPAGFAGNNPAAYPQHAWDSLDRAVTLVTEAGLRPMIDIGFWAPRWATGPQHRDPGRFRTDVDPVAFAAFAAAVARRYEGHYAPPSTLNADGASGPQPAAPPQNPLGPLLAPRPASGRDSPAQTAQAAVPLPRVDLFTLWNEPNHPGFMLPQWRKRGGKLVPDSPHRYRAMVTAAYPAVKVVAPHATVLIGGTSSMGSSVPGRTAVPPLRFLRELACVDARLRPVTAGACARFQPVPSDGWAHHPYSLRTMPDRVPRDGDLLPVARTATLRATLVALQRSGRLVGDRAADLYLTEYGYETKPPDPNGFVSPDDQARLLAWAEWLGTSTPGVLMWPQFLLEDRPGGSTGPKMRPFGDWQTGLWYADGTPKPAAAAFRTPTFARCAVERSSRWTMIWARLRAGPPNATAQVEVQAKARSTWQQLPTTAAPRAASPSAAPVGIGDDDAVTRWLPGVAAAVRVLWRTGAGEEVRGPAIRVEPCAVTSVAKQTKLQRRMPQRRPE